MAKVAVYTMDGAENGQIELNDGIFQHSICFLQVLFSPQCFGLCLAP